MATIRTAIQMVDGMSPVIRGMTNALNIVISSFEQMQKASNNSVDTSSIQAARRELSGVEASFDQVESSIRNSNSQQQQFNNSVREGQTHADGLASKIGNVVKAYLGFQAVKGVADTSDQFVQTRARLDLINDRLRTTDELQNMIFQSAQRARASYSDTANVVAKLGTLAKGSFSNNEEMVAFAEQMNKQFKIGGSSIQEQTAGMYQLTQAMASGKLQGDEFRSIMENAPLLAQAIATYTGKSMGELRKMSSEGQITADVIKKALFSTAEDTEAKFAKIPKTIGEIWINIKNQALMAFQPILLKINEVANNPNVNKMVSLMVGGFTLIANAALNVINVLANIVAFFQNNWGIIQPIIMGVVGAYIAFNLISSVTSMILGAQALAHSVAGAAAMLQAGETMAATTAQWGLNAALYACPITWIIIAIIAFIAILYIAIAVINKVQGTSYSATGLIAGAFMAIGAVVYNVVAFIWNTFAAFYEFFENIGVDKTYAVKRLFANFAINVIDSAISMTKSIDKFATNMANAIVDGINFAIRGWNKFIDLLDGTPIAEKLGLKKGTEFEHRASITSDMENLKSKLEASIANAPDGYKTVERMDYKDPVEEFKKYYAWGNNLSNMFSMPENTAANDNGFDYDQLLKNAEDTANNTGKMKDALEITDEDLKYLRDIAEQESINRFTTAEVKVEMTNQNTIGSELDLDGIIDSLGQGVYEGLQTVAEGATYDV